MATTKVSKLGNFLVIDIAGIKTYRNAAWYEILSHDNDSISMRYLGSDKQDIISIQFSDFQDETGTSYSTIGDIATYLSDKIG